MDEAADAAVVVGVDRSPGGRTALAWALDAAARRGVPLRVVAAFPVEFSWREAQLLDTRQVEDIRADVARRAEAELAEVRRDPAFAGPPGAGEVAVTVTATGGPAAEVLVQAAEGAALLVVGSRGRSELRSALLGSVALHCVIHARCPVAVVHPPAEVTARPRVVVGVDGSAGSRQALELAIAEAVRRDAEVVAVAAYSAGSYWSDVYEVVVPPLDQLREDARRGTERMVDEALAGAGEWPPVRVLPVEGPAGEVLVRQAEGAELLVVGGRGGGALRGLLLGSVALHCAVHARCPVLVVPGGR